MSELPAAKIDAIRTRDRGLAVAFLNHLLDLPEPVMAVVRNLDGSYSIQVSPATDDGARDG